MNNLVERLRQRAEPICQEAAEALDRAEAVIEVVRHTVERWEVRPETSDLAKALAAYNATSPDRDTQDD